MSNSVASPSQCAVRDLLLALAQRCEREGPSFALDRSIMYAVFNVSPQHQSEGDCPKPYTTSLDAAVTLIADGVEWSVSTLYAVARVEVGLNLNEGPRYGEHKGALVAMAVCAAALRARAALATETAAGEVIAKRSSNSTTNQSEG